MINSTAGHEPQFLRDSRRLWSLWDIMEIFFPNQLITIGGLTGHQYKLFSKVIDGRKWSADLIIAKEDRDAFDALYAHLEDVCHRLELDSAGSTIKKMRSCLEDPKSKYGQFFELGPEFEGRLTDQMMNRLYFALSMKEKEYFLNPHDGWESIVTRFPGSQIDIEEARKCFALSRYAASIFHCVQVVECGLIELGVFLNVADPKSGWTAVSAALKKIVTKDYKDWTPFERKNFEFLEQVQGTTEALKNAWRNKISHAQGRLALMAADFSPEIAEEIQFATRAFMRRLAEGLPSSEEPLS